MIAAKMLTLLYVISRSRYRCGSVFSRIVRLQRLRAERSASEETFFAMRTSRSGDDKTLQDAMMDDGVQVDASYRKSYVPSRDFGFLFP